MVTALHILLTLAGALVGVVVAIAVIGVLTVRLVHRHLELGLGAGAGAGELGPARGPDHVPATDAPPGVPEGLQALPEGVTEPQGRQHPARPACRPCAVLRSVLRLPPPRP